MDELEIKIADTILQIELSPKDAHWKANKKAILHGLKFCCEIKECEVCKGENCDLKQKIHKVIREICV